MLQIYRLRTKAGQSGDDLRKQGTKLGTKAGPKRLTPGQRAAHRIGPWPHGRVGKPNGLASGHARTAWETARTGAVGRAQGLWEQAGGDESGFLGLVDLAFLATLGGHLERCEQCWDRWIDQEVPGELLTRAVDRIPAREIFRPVLREIRAQWGRGRRRRG